MGTINVSCIFVSPRCKEHLQDLCMALPGSHDHWRVTMIVSCIFVSRRSKEHLQELCMAILGSHDHWCDTIIVSCIFVSPRCKDHLQDLYLALLGGDVNWRKAWVYLRPALKAALVSPWSPRHAFPRKQCIPRDHLFHP